jgi:tetratricopeptide (TPR) repeat protein
LRFQTDDTPEQKLEKLTQNLSQYRFPLDESAPLFGALLSLPVPEDRYPQLNLSPQRQRQKTLEAIVAIILELSEQQPVLFILEDLHWTDPTTLELLELLIDQTPTASTCVLVTCRSEFQPLWSHRSFLTEMTVHRLSRDQIERMAEQVAGEKRLPDEIVQQLVDKTDGVPLYVEEMTKAVLESGVLKETNGQYELVGSVASLAIPSTLHDSLMSRLDRLVTAKGIAQYASVIGRQFSYEVLQAVSELDEATLQRELGRLVEAELVYQRSLPPQATYTFKHALIQDTAYESLLRSTRQGYHRRIAEVLEERFPETADIQPELLAHHYTEAGLSEDAVQYWNKAGQLAIEHSAHVEAVHHLQRGLALLQTIPRLPACDQWELELQIKLGSVFSALKGYGAPEVEHAYARAHELCQQVGDTPQLFPALRGLENFYLVRGQVRRARELAEQLLTLAQRQQDPARVSLAHLALGAALYWLGENGSALAYLEQGVALCDGQPRRSSLVVHDTGVGCLMFLARTLWHLGFPARALARAREAIVLAEALAHPYNIVWSQMHIVELYIECRETQTALEVASAILSTASEHGFSFLVATITQLRSWLLVMQEQDEERRTRLQHELVSMTSGRAAFLRSYVLALLAKAYGTMGRIEEGLVELADALTSVDETGTHFYEAEIHRLKGHLLLQQSPDNATEAETCFHQAISIAQNQSAKSWELRAATSLARLWQSQGKRQEAYDLLAPVYNWFTEGFDTADLKDAKVLLDELQE